MPDVLTLTTAASVPDASLIDVPTLFVPEDDAINAAYTDYWGTARSDGQDTRFFDGVNALPREVVNHSNSPKSGHIWFKRDYSIFSDNVTTVAVDGVSTEPASGDPAFSQNVWTDYDRVYHLNSLADSSGNQNLTAVGNVSAGGDTTSPIGAGATMGNASSYFTASAIDYSNSDVTIQAWVKGGSAANDYITNIGDTGVGGKWLGVFANGNGDLAAGYDDGSSGSFFGTSHALDSGGWHSVTVVFDASASMSLYGDGVFEGSQSISAIGDVHATGNLNIGARFSNGSLLTANSWPGSLAGIRYRPGTISQALNSFENLNQSTPSLSYAASAVGGTTTVGVELAILSNVRAIVGADLSITSSIKALAGADLQILSGIASLVGADVHLRSGIRSKVGVDLQVRSAIRELAGADLSILSNIVSLSVVGATLPILSNIRENVGATVELRNAIRESVGSDVALTSNIRQLAGVSISILSDILQSGVVGITLPIRSNIRETVGADLEISSQILNTVAADVQLLSRVLETVGADLQIQSDIRQLAGATLEIRSQILADVVFRSIKRDGGIKLLQIVQKNLMVPVDQSIH